MKKQTISASDINKFTHCPYQWYYEVLYSAKAIRQARKALLTEKGYYDGVSEAFRRGQSFHKKHFFAYRLKRALIFMFLFIFAAAGVVLWLSR